MKIGIKQIDEVPIDLSIRKKRFKEMECLVDLGLLTQLIKYSIET